MMGSSGPSSIRETLIMVSKYFDDKETLTDVFQVEILLNARRCFEAGDSPVKAMETLQGSLPPMSESDRAGVLKLVLSEWRLFQLERRGQREPIRYAPRGAAEGQRPEAK